MIGLGLVATETSQNGIFKLVLTKNGTTLFNLMNKNYQKFYEGIYSEDIVKVRNQINDCNSHLYDSFKKVFTDSMPFKILIEFLNENGYVYNDRKKFMDDLFETVKNNYDINPKPYNRNARISTAGNRVPSLLQLIELFDMSTFEGTQLSFNEYKMNETFFNKNAKSISKDTLIKEAEKEELIIKETQDLIDKYGENGTVISEAIVRNSSLQKMFKQNLMILQNKQCIICGMKNPDLLIGSHIKPAVKSNVTEKVDHNNGLLLCCNHDKLFDHYLITFTYTDGQIQISKSLSKEDKKRLDLDKNFKLNKDLLTKERQHYLKLHNYEFNKREEKR